jgi:Cytochrome P450
MHKLDSFFRESQRLAGFITGTQYFNVSPIDSLNAQVLCSILLVAMERKALKDFTFSDGTFIPKGSHVAVIARPTHVDERVYEDPLTFKPFRFAEAREGANAARDAVKNQMITTSLQHLVFGHGKHAWCVDSVFHWSRPC